MKQAKTLTDKQLKAVVTHCATRRHAVRDRAIVLFSHLAGLRAKEIALLTVENVLGEQGIRDEFVLTAEQTKGRKARRVFVSSRLRQELAGYLKHAKLRTGCDALFQSHAIST